MLRRSQSLSPRNDGFSLMIETLRHIDHQLFALINQGMANPVLDVVCPILRGKPFLALFYCVAGYYLYRTYPKQFIKIAAAGAVTFLLTDQLSATVIKSIFHRLRPCNNAEIGARLLLDHCGGGFSFVSAHAANSFGMAAFISSVFMYRKSVIVLTFTWAALVALSQVYVGVHFPADITGGALLGIVTGSTTAYALKRWLPLKVE
ncbi:MAG: hypothetical protein RLZZ367_1561 [Bacteroidota bacterium]